MLEFCRADRGKCFAKSTDSGRDKIVPGFVIVSLEQIQRHVRKILLEFGEEGRVFHINFGLFLGFLRYVLVGLVEYIGDETGVERVGFVVVKFLPEHFERLVRCGDAVLGELGEPLLQVFAKCFDEMGIGSFWPFSRSIRASISPQKS